MRKPVLASVAVASVALACLATAGAAETPAAPVAEASRFLILVHGGEPRAATREAVVEEYRQWARRLAAEGRLVAADELVAEAVVLSAGDAGGEPRRASRQAPAGGYFLVSAADLEAALVLARECPALRHGGAVEVVPIRRN